VSTTDDDLIPSNPTSRPPPAGRGRRVGEAEVVLTSQIAPVLRRWMEVWKANYPTGTVNGQHSGGGNDFVGPLEWLSQESGIAKRQISRIRAEEQHVTSLSHAEALLMAMDREYMLHTGEIRVIPNPNWSQEQYVDYMRERGGC
jgi:hypothetical protein